MHRQLQSLAGLRRPLCQLPPAAPLSVSKPAIIISPTVEVKSRQDAVELFKNNINYRASNYAPARIQPVSKNKLRVEFDNKTQLKDTLTRLQGKSELKAEPVRKLRPMVILKGISKDVPADDLIQSLSRQNTVLTELINNGGGENLKLRFKRENRNANLYNAVLLVEPKLYNKMLDMGRISVEYQRVHVASFSPFLQCHKCLQFGHTKLRCTADQNLCSHCASTEHDVGKCPNKDKPNSVKCYNCHTHNTRFNTKMDTKHTANSNTCPRLRAMREKINNRVDYGYTP
ncbi:unnamed protein product [Parnassius apollo]|uniref:(apollo) hypothetical protein n=1 Tax=Parnassius apollo TaxID=110799 RepID=A0A8S3WH69_PARAO|nr:unnamed protein product [Parnassius apollo]